MSLDPHLELAPMQLEDVEDVLFCETEAAKFPWGRQHFIDALNSGYRCLVLRSGGVLLGQAVLMGVLDEMHLLIITISPAWQGMGLGRQLLAELIRDAAAGGARQMFLEVRPSNAPALTLYRKLGFAEIGRRKDYYPAYEGREDALVMRLEL
jgi:ribosomal-protein-alanine N-acetyltransferase